MACNSCSKPFSLFRPEKGCPSCGFSYCAKCLKSKLFVKKLNSEVMVCTKCKQSSNAKEPVKIEPPDAYYKRIGGTDIATGVKGSTNEDSVDREIAERLNKLKQDKLDSTAKTSNDHVTERLQKLKGEVPTTSDAELTSRLANIKGVPISALQTKQSPTISVNKTEQEQIEELMKQYMEQGSIDKKYQDEFDGLVCNIEARLQKLKASQPSEPDKTPAQDIKNDSEDEAETIKKIIEEVTAEAKFNNVDAHSDPVMEELPFCEICNEDAKMRCLGCKYLFCKQCFKEHEDEDDGCDKFELYTPPKNFVM